MALEVCGWEIIFQQRFVLSHEVLEELSGLTDIELCNHGIDVIVHGMNRQDILHGL